jgi:hypothetical protein
MDSFTGKGHTSSDIAYGRFKRVPVKVMLTIRNNAPKAREVAVIADLHDTYHDNGQRTDQQTIGPYEEKLITLSAPSQKWIRKLSVSPISELVIEDIQTETSKRNEL